MDTARTVADLRRLVGMRRARGDRVALVPTMGALHEGHLSLIRSARDHADAVVVSMFVNPTQFDDASDLAAYPRDDARDLSLADAAGADIAFIPTVDQVYPHGFATTVRIDGPITETLEGEVRGPAHFWGVATVVAKLFGMVQPDIALFGQKDAQQCVVVRRLASDLDIPVDIVVCPTVREPDGLAMSSRNVRLSSEERTQALSLSAALARVREAVIAGERSVAALEHVGVSTIESAGAAAEYFRGVHPDTLEPMSSAGSTVLFVTAARVGKVRLIDNMLVSP